MFNVVEKKKNKMVISARDIMNAPKGHPARVSGCGAHRNKKVNPPRANNRREDKVGF